MKGLSVCLSVGIDVSLFNWKIIFLFTFPIQFSFLFLIRVRAGVGPRGSFSFTAGLSFQKCTRPGMKKIGVHNVPFINFEKLCPVIVFI